MNEIQHLPLQSVWPVRVYYEDTDAGGVVYYANYLKFCERARTEWLRSLGISQHHLLTERSLAFVVAHFSADYLKSAELDDELAVISTIAGLGAATITFRQEVRRGGTLLFAATVKVACVDWAQRRAARIPDDLRPLFESKA
ncbi:tol-pal system-associated acyl-CoA thioesterase [Uliginosibacterium gangwonense]|uniref:tol-pal system-associated acyl-CoA thioesterase n=1 Tax=Uliginosibacterium gangwonense TaxID=392736 RepID=UPI0003778BD9|nr:tol-pal system-associated acyl-CoA thioesterase [Uliginosibacterium gangwonense]